MHITSVSFRQAPLSMPILDNWRTRTFIGHSIHTYGYNGGSQYRETDKDQSAWENTAGRAITQLSFWKEIGRQ